MIAKPSKGRYFPISPARAFSLTKDWLYFVWDDEQRKGNLSFANTKSQSIPFPLVMMESASSITIFSVPEELDSLIASNAIELALELCAELNQRWKTPRGNSTSQYIIYLAELRSLSVAERTIQYRPRKYRGTQKFSNAFKSQKLGEEEKEIRRLPLRAAVTKQRSEMPRVR